MAYTPRYVTLADVPVQIPDDYSQQEKEDALEIAEGLLDSRLNDGDDIPSGDVTPLMRAAVKQRATCEMAKGAEHNDDVALGDLDDSGDTKVSYAQSFCDSFDDIIDTIQESGAADHLSGDSKSPYSYSTKDPDKV